MTAPRPVLRELLLLLLGLLAQAAAVLVPWWVMGPTSPVLAPVITAGIFGTAPLLSPAGALIHPRRAAAGAAELRMLERCGVPRLAALLERTGWNRGIGRARAGRTRRELEELAVRSRRALMAHTVSCVAHLGGCVLLTVDGSLPQGAALLLLGMLLHGLPVLLQRWVLGRLARTGITRA